MKVAARAMAGFVRGFATGMGLVLAAMLLFGLGLAIILDLLGVSGLDRAALGAGRGSRGRRRGAGPGTWRAPWAS